MNFFNLLTRVSIAATEEGAAAAPFGDEHEILNWLFNTLTKFGTTFGGIADKLYSSNVDISESTIATAMEATGAGLLTFFMVLEIVTYCFNVDFHMGFESGLKIGVKTVLLYIIVENCMDAAKIVIGVFKMENTVDFSKTFAAVSEPFAAMGTIPMSDSGISQYIEPFIFGFVLVIICAIMVVVFSLLIISMIGIVAETAILTAISPVACSTLVNHMMRDTGIRFLKDLAAISMQWGVIALCFDVYESVSVEITGKFSTLVSGTEHPIIACVLTAVGPLLCVVALSTMISRSGEITKRALGV